MERIYIIVGYNNDYYTKQTEFVTATSEEKVIEFVLNERDKERWKVRRIFSVDEYGKEITYYELSLKDFEVKLEAIKEEKKK